MPARNPGFAVINNRKVKVQHWQQFADRIELTALVRGDQPGKDLVEHLKQETVSLEWDDSGAIMARPESGDHHVAGSGPATVHRISVTLWLPESAQVPERAIDDRLDQILREVQLLRREVAELRALRRPSSASMASSLTAGQTMLDFDIDTDEEP